MLRKFFRSLTQSDEERYLETFEAFAQSLQTTSPQLAHVARDVAQLKAQVDQCVDGSKPAPFEIQGLGEKAKIICDGVQASLRELQQLDQELPSILTSGDGEQLTAHFNRLETLNQLVMRAAATLRHAVTGNGPTSSLTSFPVGDDAMKAALEDLDVQIRTAERIKNELGG